MPGRSAPALVGAAPPRPHSIETIDAGRLHYASDFFVSLFPSPEAGRRHEEFIAALSVLQENLGELNDLELERRILKHCSGRDKKRAAASQTPREIAATR